MHRDSFIYPNWPAPARVKSLSTTRVGGFSESPWDSFNLAQHVGDAPDRVDENRQLLMQFGQLPEAPNWMDQVHGCEVITQGTHPSSSSAQADACYTDQPEKVCAVMTADCLPLLLCDRQGLQVAAIHAGWRGLIAGVIEQGVSRFSGESGELLVWLGPAIGAKHFEVGSEVKAAFEEIDSNAKKAFRKSSNGRWLCDLYLLAKQRLNKLGVSKVYTDDYCTFSDSQRFFSYRRTGQTGRMATMIWIEK